MCRHISELVEFGANISNRLLEETFAEERRSTLKRIRTELKRLMQEVDLDQVTSREVSGNVLRPFKCIA